MHLQMWTAISVKFQLKYLFNGEQQQKILEFSKVKGKAAMQTTNSHRTLWKWKAIILSVGSDLQINKILQSKKAICSANKSAK